MTRRHVKTDKHQWERDFMGGLTGQQRHTKRHLYGHYFVNKKCVLCGLTTRESGLRFGIEQA